MIRRADSREVARDAVVLDLGDLLAHGQHIERTAKERAEALLAGARIERDRLIGEAAATGHAQGFAKGLNDGRAQGMAEGKAEAAAEHAAAIETLTAAWSAALDSFESQRQAILTEARRDVLRLALTIAHKVTHRIVETDPLVVADQLEAVLSLVSRPTRLSLCVHPDDLSCAAEVLPALIARFAQVSEARIEETSGVTRGSCIARTEGGASIDASIGVQLERITEALVPGASTAGEVSVQSSAADEGTRP